MTKSDSEKFYIKVEILRKLFAWIAFKNLVEIHFITRREHVELRSSIVKDIEEFKNEFKLLYYLKNSKLKSVTIEKNKNLSFTFNNYEEQTISIQDNHLLNNFNYLLGLGIVDISYFSKIAQNHINNKLNYRFRNTITNYLKNPLSVKVYSWQRFDSINERISQLFNSSELVFVNTLLLQFNSK